MDDELYYKLIVIENRQLIRKPIRYIYDMLIEGYGCSEIADRTGKGKGTIWRYIDEIRKTIKKNDESD